MLVDDSLVGQQVNEVEAGQVSWVFPDVGIVRPGGRLSEVGWERPFPQSHPSPSASTDRYIRETRSAGAPAHPAPEIGTLSPQTPKIANPGLLRAASEVPCSNAAVDLANDHGCR